MHLIQIQHPDHGLRVGIVEEPAIHLLSPEKSSMYDLFGEVINGMAPLSPLTDRLKTDEQLSYDQVYEGRSPWKILPAADVPGDPMRCILSGTGLTHRASAENRQKMHQMETENQLSDSIKMYLWGEEGGKPGKGEIGVQPEWFYKGNGTGLAGHGDPLPVPDYADDGGEEPELAGIYLISDKGIPFRIGLVQANEFSDHVMEKKNYLYLAPSKLRSCAIGPELVTDRTFDSIPGEVRIQRGSGTLWSQEIRTGEAAMAHSLANLEHHHFKYAQHRVPGQLHIHFFGASAFSFGAEIRLQDGDLMSIHFQDMGRPLVNPLCLEQGPPRPVEVQTLK